ncbi:MAG: hypothetical protein K2X43_14025 [Hyphomonadaceae bacterium]|jgi:hypothetical protein|nr:hypothetical protein [Hyphomonadaceae bacterium]
MTVGGSGPVALGAGSPRSIKDEPAPVVTAPGPKRAPTQRTAIALPPPRQPVPRAASKRLDVPTCVSGSECMVRLKAMIDDPARTWIGQSQPPAEYANGTRLFAYRALRSQLTCPQLNTALSEIAAAANTFRAQVPGVDAVQAKRIRVLNAEVERELQAEFTGRCKG